MPKPKLTAKQRRFVEEYLVDLNATQAALRAGYSKKTAHTTGHENLRKPEIASAVEAAQAERAKRTEVTADRVVQELARVGFSDIRNLFTPGGHLLPPEDWPDEVAAAVAGIDVVIKPTGLKDEDGRPEVEHVHKIKLWDKNSALEKLGKHLSMFIERHELTGKDGGPLAITREIIDPNEPTDSDAESV